MRHRPQMVQDGLGRWRSICNCKATSNYMVNRQEAEDWQVRHLRLAEQALVHLRDKTPTLIDQYNYYTQMAQNPENNPADRVLWQQLANGLRPRLPSQSPAKVGDEGLPFEVKYTPRRVQRDDP